MIRITIVFAAFLFFGLQNAKAQVGINTSTPRATLDVVKNEKLSETTPQGVLFPQFTTQERDDLTKKINAREGKENKMPTGLMIYNTTTKTIDLYNGSGWVSLKYKVGTENKTRVD